MPELKTLKDIRDSIALPYATYDRLREEAINWVKFFKSQMNGASEKTTFYKKKLGASRSFMEFFNITSEELKDE